MAFLPAFLDEIRARVPVSAVVGRTVRLVRKGHEYLGLCPFHNEKTPSFTVNDDKGFFHCFGCGAHGDVIAFVMRTQSLSFPEAIERLATEAGLEVPQQVPEERERSRRAASLHDACEAACAFFEKTLREPAGRQGLAYLVKRGLDPDTVARFRLGFAPDSRSALKQALKAKGIEESLAIEAGLLIRPEGDGEPYDRFRGRVMFPITDRRGRVIAFGGRIMGEGQPKYLNSPETPLFHKGAVLYGLAQAREAAVKAGTLVVCEGYMDVIAMSQAGFGHAVAPLGTALTEAQIESLWRLAPEPIVCLDGDAAGQRAAWRAAERALPLLKPGVSLRFALLPSPEDPDSLIRTQGKEAMAAVLAAATPLHEMVWSFTLAESPVDTPERKAGLERRVMDFAEEIADPTVRENYRRFFKDRLWDLARPARPARPPMPAFKGRKLVRRHSLDRDVDGRLPGLGPPPPPKPASFVQEELLLLIVVNHPSLLDSVAERLGEMSFADSDLDNLRVEVLKHLDVWGSLDSGGARLHLMERGFSRIVGRLETGAHEHSATVGPDAPITAAASLWEHVYKRYTEKDLSAELRYAEQRLGADLSEESFSYLTALWASKIGRAES